MKTNDPLQIAPPWGSKAAWQEAHGNIDYHLWRYQDKLKPVVTAARKVRVRLELIFPLLDELCTMTCTRCPEPCCLTASLWYDFRDLLFLHSNQLAVPLSQPIDDYKISCCYLNPRGCSLSRSIRPWICTWYLCPVQMAHLKNRRLHQWKTINHTIRKIKRDRQRMEEAFIGVVTSNESK